MIKRLKLGLHILLLLSGTLELHANGFTSQESVQQAQHDEIPDFDEFLSEDEGFPPHVCVALGCVPLDKIRGYRELMDEVLTFQERETVTVQIQRIKDLDLLIEMLEQDENDSPEIAQRFRALREECQIHRAALYEDLARLKAALALMRARQENVSSEVKG